MGIRDKPIAPASPWQNGVVERLIGSIRRECGPHHCPGRGTSAPDSEILRSLLQKDADALGIGQGCAGFSLGSANRCGQVTCHPRRTSSPLRPSLSFWYTQPSRNETNSSRVNVGADKTWAIRRICAYGWPVQASHPAPIKLTHYLDGARRSALAGPCQPPGKPSSRGLLCSGGNPLATWRTIAPRSKYPHRSADLRLGVVRAAVR